MTLTNRLTIYLWVRQTANFQDLGFKWTARKYIMLTARKCLLELDIRYYPPVQRIELEGRRGGDETRPPPRPSNPSSAYASTTFGTPFASGDVGAVHM